MEVSYVTGVPPNHLSHGLILVLKHSNLWFWGAPFQETTMLEL